jgi:hypothetical protein
MNVDQVLVIEGAKEVDDLKSYGIELADKYAKADIVIFANSKSSVRFMKWKKMVGIEFVNLETFGTDCAQSDINTSSR